MEECGTKISALKEEIMHMTYIMVPYIIYKMTLVNLRIFFYEQLNKAYIKFPETGDFNAHNGNEIFYIKSISYTTPLTFVNLQ
uniref:Uncharacterized protein n=1 Tax=Megaselia scalaris TaxID=36166 RepID=T1GVY2_MEGSC